MIEGKPLLQHAMASEHTRMGMGLCNAPATFQRSMQLVLRDLTWTQVLVYLDDVVVLGKNFDDGLTNLQAALERFRQFTLKPKPKKCQLFQPEVEFLCYPKYRTARKWSSAILVMSC